MQHIKSNCEIPKIIRSFNSEKKCQTKVESSPTTVHLYDQKVLVLSSSSNVRWPITLRSDSCFTSVSEKQIPYSGCSVNRPDMILIIPPSHPLPPHWLHKFWGSLGCIRYKQCSLFANDLFLQYKGHTKYSYTCKEEMTMWWRCQLRLVPRYTIHQIGIIWSIIDEGMPIWLNTYRGRSLHWWHNPTVISSLHVSHCWRGAEKRRCISIAQSKWL